MFCLALACAAGCGKADRADNSHIQTPNDQPIGPPKSAGGGKVMPLGRAPVGGGAQSGGAGAPLPKIEVKK